MCGILSLQRYLFTDFVLSFVTALTVRYLTRRYIGEYRSNTGKPSHIHMYCCIRLVLETTMVCDNSYSLKPQLSVYSSGEARFTKINRIHSTGVCARHADVEHILKWCLLRHPIIYYFTMSRSNPNSLSIPTFNNT